jgi:hypothetical protein
MQNKTSLITLLLKMKDKRKASGKRHQFIHILLIIIMGTMSGYEGYRGLECFTIRYDKELIKVLGINRKQTPSMSTIRRVIMNIDFNRLSQLMYQWTRQRVAIRKGEWIACDGKGIRGSITECSSKYQNFVNIVSIYCTKAGVVLSMMAVNNKDTNEITALRKILEALELEGLVITADAIHCQKKLFHSSVVKEGIT